MKSACLKAGAKLGIGLTLVAAVIGIRMISVTPDGVPAAIEKLEALDSELAAESAEKERAASAGDSENSIVSRLGAGIGFSDSEPDSRDGDRLVSCKLSGRNQFMRADDCAMRGGEPTYLSDGP